VLGLSVGALVQVAAATGGLSAILVTSAIAFGVVKTLGAIYLIYLGIRTLLVASWRIGPSSAIQAVQPL
jgi:threonine/homoserine/homoserine lactone efflux protein